MTILRQSSASPLMRNYLLFSIVVIFFGCSNPEQELPKMIPSDYLFSQRAYPHGDIDIEAYRNAMTTRLSESSATRSYDEKWWREGPTNLCGRITDLEMPEGDTSTIYAGTASGGIFISDDKGESWKSIFDDQPTQAIGDMAISKRNTEKIYVGTGESNAGGGSLVYDGVGMFRSDDAGNNWEHIGLENAGSIGRVAIHPQDDDVVYVAAMGALFKNDSNRGIYKTTDGGMSWEQVLFVSDSTGGIDIVVHPENGDILYAALWERIKKPYNRQFGGETSGIFQSTDGGATWVELTNGLPTAAEDKGRIALALSDSDPNILYAFYANTQGSTRGMFKSVDGGESWVQKNTNGISNTSFMWWFGRIFVHPQDPEDVYVTSIRMSRSRDGGDTWTEIFRDAHVDHHAMYIHPTRSDLVFNGNDGGVNLGMGTDYITSSYKSGLDNFQFYTCEIDPTDPSRIYGGTQDNGTNRKSDDNTDSWSLLSNGDGFTVIVDPRNPDIIYAQFARGRMRVSFDGGMSFEGIRNGLEGKFNWNAPLEMDPFASEVLYTGSDKLYKSSDRGAEWKAISPSLVNDNNPAGNETYGSLTCIDVADHNSALIYIGTDDGNVWVTQDAGENYENISQGLPQRWVTSIAHDPHNVEGVYVTLSGFRFGDAEAQVFYSSDKGNSWEAIGGGLPDVPISDVLIDSLVKDLIFVASDIGVYYSENAGASWSILGMDMPAVPVLDLDLHSPSRKLLAATFGRGMYSYELPDIVSTVDDQSIGSPLLYFPNPTSGKLFLNQSIDLEELVVIGPKGDLVLRSEKTDVIDIRGLAKGVYLLHSTLSNGEKSIHKIILK